MNEEGKEEEREFPSGHDFNPATLVCRACGHTYKRYQNFGDSCPQSPLVQETKARAVERLLDRSDWRGDWLKKNKKNRLF